MKEIYIKSSNGEFILTSIDKIITKDWDNKLIIVRLGTDEFPAGEEKIDEAIEALSEADVLQEIDTSFLVTSHHVECEILDNVEDVGKKYITVAINSNDDLSKLGKLQKKAKEQLRGKVKKVIYLPALSVDDYNEVMEIKRRCDNRRNRRGV